MTGYALVRRETPAGELTVSLRSVNHRGLDLHFHHIGELAIFENACRALLKQQISRGHVEVRLSFAKEEDAIVPLRSTIESFFVDISLLFNRPTPNSGSTRSPI